MTDFGSLEASGTNFQLLPVLQPHLEPGYENLGRLLVLANPLIDCKSSVAPGVLQ